MTSKTERKGKRKITKANNMGVVVQPKEKSRGRRKSKTDIRTTTTTAAINQRTFVLLWLST
jgi:hypothetical protein